MPKRGGWRTILKYAAGILALSASIAVAWFLPGLYAGWQDARTEGHVVLSRRENIQFIDTASLDIAGRLQMLEETKDFYWTWGISLGMETPVEELIGRCHETMENWCEARLFPEGCLAGIVRDNLYLNDTVTVHLDNASLLMHCFRFYDVGGYAVTLVTDAEADMIYYASVTGPSMLDVVAEDLGYESFAAMGEYVLRMTEEMGIDPEKSEDASDFFSYLAETVRPEEESDYDFAAVCGAQGMKAERRMANLELDVELSFETFSGHAYRRLATTNYNMDPNKVGVGFAVMYGALQWKDLAEDFLAIAGATEFVPDEALEFYEIGADYARGDPDVIDYLDYQMQPAGTDGSKVYGAAQELPRSEAYDEASAAEDGYGEVEAEKNLE